MARKVTITNATFHIGKRPLIKLVDVFRLIANKGLIPPPKVTPIAAFVE